MDINKPKYGTSSYRVACAVIFVSFSIIYLFHYQTNVLAAAQHIASGGKTHYDPVIGPLLIIVATVCSKEASELCRGSGASFMLSLISHRF